MCWSFFKTMASSQVGLFYHFLGIAPLTLTSATKLTDNLSVPKTVAAVS